MPKFHPILLQLAALTLASSGKSLDYTWSTLAGNTQGPGCADGIGTAVRFHHPSGMAKDVTGNVYIADWGNHVIRRMTPDGSVTVFAGKRGHLGSLDGLRGDARFYFPTDIAVDASGNLFVAEPESHTIRMITPNGAVTTLAGKAGQSSFMDGTGSLARFNTPTGLTVQPDGSVVVAEFGNHTIRRITPDGMVRSLAGDPFYRDPDFPNPEFAPRGGYADGVGWSALFRWPSDVEADASGNLLVLDGGNHVMRRIDDLFHVTTVTLGNTSPGMLDARRMLPEADGSFVLVRGSSVIWAKPDGTLQTLGSDTGPNGGVLPSSGYNEAPGLIADGAGGFLVSSLGGHDIRRMRAGSVPVSVVGSLLPLTGSTDGSATEARFKSPASLAVDASRNVFVADTDNRTLRKISPDGAVTTLAGFAGSYTYVDGAGSQARFQSMRGLALDAAGMIYVTDGYAVRRITPEGVVSTWAGSPNTSGTSDGTAGNARFQLPVGIAARPDGTLYVADLLSHTVRKITPEGVVSTLAGSPGLWGYVDGPGTQARLNRPENIAVDGAGNIYVTQDCNDPIRKITPDGEVSTLPRSSTYYGEDRDGELPQAGFFFPSSICADLSGNVFVASVYNATVRRITPDGIVTTIGGTRMYGQSNGTGANAGFYIVAGLATGPGGRVYASESHGHRIAVGTPAFAPDIAVQLDPGADLPDAALVTYTATRTDQMSPLTFRLLNRGEFDLAGLSLAIDGRDSSSFALRQENPTDPIPPGGVSEFTVLFAPQSHGELSAVVRVRSNDADEPSFSFRVEGEGVSRDGDYLTWITSRGFPPANQAPEADADGDGLPNLTEFALGTYVEYAGEYDQPKIIKTSAGLVCQFLRRDESERSVALHLEWSLDLTTWTRLPVPALTEAPFEVIESWGSLDRVSFPLPASTGGRLYVRFAASFR